MLIDKSLWASFEVYLFVDRKMSTHHSSIYPMRSRFNKLIHWFHGKDFTRDNVNLFIGQMQRDRAAASYINKMIALCKHLDKFLGLNQLHDYTYFHETYQPKVVLTAQEIEALAGTTLPYRKYREYMNLRQKCLILLLGTTGSRVGEALNLKWTDVCDAPPHIIYRETKNGDVRAVPIGKVVYDLLQSLPRLSENVFSSYRGGVFDHQQVNLDLKARAAAVGITKPVYNHIFRHSYITTMLELGVDISDVARIVGHKSLNSTMRYKNSLLSYYNEIVQLHPIFKNSISLSQITSQMKADVTRMVDKSGFKVTMFESLTTFKLEITMRST